MSRARHLIALAMAATFASAAGAVDFQKDIRPLLKSRCFACHGALKQKAGLRLDTVAALRKGGESGPALQPGQPDKSRIIERITTAKLDDRMPPEGEPLHPREIEALRQWIAAGAPASAQDEPEVDPRAHWAFRAPAGAAAPVPKSANLIDALLGVEHRQRGVKPLPAEDKPLLLRRVHLDLVGLPPTREELRAFLADASPDAYEKVVDRLLASPQHGERWGRHWMDIWRYTDWYGLGAQLRHSQKHIWHWRDWIIESLNTDKGYDLMIRQMLAADELWPADRDALRATGFLARNYYLFNRTTSLDDTVEHTAKAFLGLTFQCAKCHDHKYDPITHVDYYKLRAFFEPHYARLDPWPGEIDLEKDGLPRVFDAHPAAPTYLHRRGNDTEPDTNRVIAPGVPELFTFAELAIKPIALPPGSHSPALLPFVLEDHLRAATNEIHAARAVLENARRQIVIAQNATQAKPQPEIPAVDFLKDNFAKADSAMWETGPGEWKHADGRLAQTKIGGTERAWLRTKQNHPPDFEAQFRFKITGGTMWKSVGLCFDAVGGREKLVYLSATGGGPKLQISHNTGSGHAYPPSGTQARPVKLNETYELTVRVRGPLINVAMDGKHALAYRLPVQREAGRLELITFDAAAEFLSIQVRPLPATLAMTEGGAGAALAVSSVADAKLALVVAEKGLAAAELRGAALKTAHAADIARAQDHNSTLPSANTMALVRAAALAARQHEAAKVAEAVAKAEQKVAAADAKTKAQAGTELKAAQGKLAEAQKSLTVPGDKYTSLRASSKALEGPEESEASRSRPYPKISTGRRSALANWVTDRRNPLTARVAVNHIWLRHFGQPLVDPVSDFGRRTAAPPLQALLDSLAMDFMENGWQMKRLHRLMVTSQAYRRSSTVPEGFANASDAGNQFFWRRNVSRMESDIIRDSLLHLGGVLNPQLGGPTISPKGADTAGRRSLYFTHSRDDVNPFLDMFDHVNQLDCYRRFESIVPQQALALANSELAMTLSRKLAARLEASGAAEDFTVRAFEAILSRAPTPAEVEVCAKMLGETEALLRYGKHAEPARRARENLVHALVNHNDFITVR